MAAFLVLAGGGGPWLAFILSVLAGAGALLLGLHRIKLVGYDLENACRGFWLAAGLGVAALFLMAPIDAILWMMAFFLGHVGLRVGLLRILLQVGRVVHPVQRVVIYGAGQTGMQIASALRLHRRIRPVAFVDDDKSLWGTDIAGLTVLPPQDLAEIVRKGQTAKVLLAIPSAPAARQRRIVTDLRGMGTRVVVCPSLSDLMTEEGQETGSIDRFLGRAGVPLTAGAELKGLSVMVTGAGGSIGSELCRQLLAMSVRRLVLLERSEIALYSLMRELSPRAEAEGVTLVPVLASILDAALVARALRENSVSEVFHAAAYKHVPMIENDPVSGLANNSLGTRVLGEVAVKCGVRRFTLISTDKAVSPASIMGASKRLAELIVQDLARRSANTAFAIVRFGNVLGSSGSVVPLFRKQIAEGGPVTVTHPEVTRYFMSVGEAVHLVLEAGGLASAGDAAIFVLDMGAPRRIADLANEMVRAAGYRPFEGRQGEGDIEIRYTGLRPGEKLHESLASSDCLVPTSNPRILRAKEDALSQLETAAALRALRDIVAEGDPVAAREFVSRWVPGYNAGSAALQPCIPQAPVSLKSAL
ncbi:polysaccharide biosynthesis protein [Halodurantibacterium flavum]|uniref:Polysaccharide biosynthesis protein n=1 Tax=Halodurantibacterium flavum TaxID=1382802 RepID=A0ABW4S7A8_9RHOB